MTDSDSISVRPSRWWQRWSVWTIILVSGIAVGILQAQRLNPTEKQLVGVWRDRSGNEIIHFYQDRTFGVANSPQVIAHWSASPHELRFWIDPPSNLSWRERIDHYYQKIIERRLKAWEPDEVYAIVEITPTTLTVNDHSANNVVLERVD